jgi:hypothetical protein
MINQIERGPMAVAAKDMQSGAKYVGRAVTAFFFATLERLYAAHMEKAQMRLAPLPPARRDRGLRRAVSRTNHRKLLY